MNNTEIKPFSVPNPDITSSLPQAYSYLPAYHPKSDMVSVRDMVIYKVTVRLC